MIFLAPLTLLLLLISKTHAKSNTSSPSTKIGYLTVPSASLYYEAICTGPLLLLVPGGNGDTDIFRNLATFLQSTYTVLIYDRRGFSRSYLSSTQSQDYTNRLSIDVNDARLPIEHLSPNQTATVLGTSSGAIVALELLVQYSSLLHTLIPHEPPALRILPDRDALTIAQKGICETYRSSGVPPRNHRVRRFIRRGKPNASTSSSMDPRRGNFIAGNNMYWLERELVPYPLQEFNLSAMRQYKGLLLLANGRETDREAPQYRANTVLAENIGLEVTLLPGPDLGYQTDPQEFEEEWMVALRKKDAGAGEL